MSHNLDYLPWRRRTRRRMAAVLLTALVVLFFAEFTYSNLSEAPTLATWRGWLGTVLPWLDIACGIVAMASWGALASTWSARDWWAERWVRSHESFVG